MKNTKIISEWIFGTDLGEKHLNLKDVNDKTDFLSKTNIFK